MDAITFEFEFNDNQLMPGTRYFAAISRNRHSLT